MLLLNKSGIYDQIMILLINGEFFMLTFDLIKYSARMSYIKISIILHKWFQIIEI